MPQDQDDIKGADAMKQAPTPGPLSGDDDLLPCPFCEGDVIVTDSQECQDAETYYWHRCAGCGVESEGAHGASAARDQWNLRPQVERLAPAPVASGGQHSSGEGLSDLVDVLSRRADAVEGLIRPGLDPETIGRYEGKEAAYRHAAELARAVAVPVAETAGEALWFEKGFTSPNVPAQDDDKLRRAVEALEQIVDLGSDGEHSGDRHARCRDIARSALKSTAAEEGGE